jgi:photosystem II stability/assembly factor-like uncharacterized protein
VPILGALLVGGAIVLTVLLRTEGASPAGDHVLRSANALLVDRVAADSLLAGTDTGVLASSDGGRTWARSGLEGRHIAALARLKDGTIWAGGRSGLARSVDNGRSWVDAYPAGLPALDVLALSASRDVQGRLEAAIAGYGLFRSADGGGNFAKLGLSRRVGSEARALAETIDGVIFVSDERLGVVVNGSGDGREWLEALGRSPHSLAPNYDDRHHATLLAGTEAGVLRTTDKGQSWHRVLALGQGAGPVAFAQSRVGQAYVVAADGAVYRSDDFGATWAPVG